MIKLDENRRNKMGTVLAFFLGWFLISIPSSLIIGALLAMKNRKPKKAAQEVYVAEPVTKPSFSIN